MDCKCTFAQKMVGDGCDICNPDYQKQLQEEAENTCAECGELFGPSEEKVHSPFTDHKEYYHKYCFNWIGGD